MAGLLRYQIFLSFGFLILGIWYAGIQNKAMILNGDGISIPLFSSFPTSAQEATIDYLPIWVLFCLAIYAVGSITYGVVNFADCPDAAKEVEKHIIEAKAEMKKRNIGD